MADESSQTSESNTDNPPSVRALGNINPIQVPTSQAIIGAPPPNTPGQEVSDNSVATANISDTPILDTGLHCFAMMARFLDQAINPEQIAHELGRGNTGDAPLDETDILRAAKTLGIKARATNTAWDRLSAGTKGGPVTLPVLACKTDGTFLILAKRGDGDKDGMILVHDPVAGRAEEYTRDMLEAVWDGRVIQMTSRSGLTGEGRRFDVSWFIPAIVKYRHIFSEVLAASFFIQMFALISPLFFMVIIDKVLVHRGLSSLDVLVLALVTVSLFEVLLGGLRTYIFSHTTNRIDVTLGASLFKHLLRLPISYFGSRRVGETVARVRELENIRNFLTGSALTLVIDLAFTVVFFAVMFWIAPLLCWIVAGSIPLYVIFSLIITPALRARVEEKFQRGAVNQAFLVESVTGVETLKAAAVEPQMQRRWEEQLAAYVSSSFKAANLSNIAGQGVQLIQKLTMALTLWFGAKLVIEGQITVGQLVAFNMLSGRVSQPILRLAQLWQDFQQVRISIDRLGDILNEKTETVAGAGRAALADLKGDVSFEDVVFRYKPDTPEVLKGITFHVPAGQMIGIAGPSGSGKSTLTKLVQRLYLPESGRVLVDGVDLSTVDPSWLRRQIGVVLQENILFNRSVRDNIALADPSMPLERAMDAAKLAGAHDFITELPEGYDTIIEERGGSLSGGQRQRIAIARALVTKPRILIFDEATSALDYESEQAVQSNMREIAKGRTVFVIAHRLSTIRECNRIITVEAGEIVEDGTHTSLLASGGRYSRLWNAQMSGLPDSVKELDALPDSAEASDGLPDSVDTTDAPTVEAPAPVAHPAKRKPRATMTVAGSTSTTIKPSSAAE